MQDKTRINDLQQKLKFLEHQLAEMKAEYNLMLERYNLATSAAKVGVWDWDIISNEFYLDPNVKAILGYADHEIPNDVELWAKYVHPDDQGQVMNAAQEHLDGKSDEYYFEHRMIHKDGTERWILVRGKAIFDNRGVAVRMNGTDEDITERKLAELEKERLFQDLEKALQEIKTLRGIIPICSHCKKIRDDKGYWNVLEAYIQRHSGASFSHSMCPECCDKLYGHEDWYIEMKTNEQGKNK